jgi:hypothetical protein
MADNRDLFGGINSASTVTDLRRQLHEQKARERYALQEQQQATPVQRFLRSEWLTAVATFVIVFIILYGSNPYAVQQPSKNYELPKPNLNRILLYSGLAGAFVGFGPWALQKMLSKK